MADPFVGSIKVNNAQGREIAALGQIFKELKAGQGKPGQAQLTTYIWLPGLTLADSEGQPSLTFHANRARLTLGGNGADSSLLLRDSSEGLRVTIKTEDGGEITVGTIVLEGATGNMYAGGKGTGGNVFVFHPLAADIKGQNATIHLDGTNANLFVGGNNAQGDVLVFPDSAPSNTDGGNATVVLSGSASGRITLRTATGPAPNDTIVLGGDPVGGRIAIRTAINDDAAFPENLFPVFGDSIVLDGKTGDITLVNGDCAEDFEVVDFDEAIPGTVMALETEGRLRRTNQAYDKRVVGIVSGAGKLRPGIVLGRDAGSNLRRPIALAGRVNCKVDAGYAPIEAGDLLTSSGTPGHAMKVLDERAAFGAVIGKALAALGNGKNLLPVLVALQ